MSVTFAVDDGADMPVFGSSLAELLDAALTSGGELPAPRGFMSTRE